MRKWQRRSATRSPAGSTPTRPAPGASFVTDRFARTAERVAARQDARAERLAHEVRDFVRPRGDERALDVGAGAGALALALAPLVRDVVGLDPVPELLELGHRIEADDVSHERREGEGQGARAGADVESPFVSTRPDEVAHLVCKPLRTGVLPGSDAFRRAGEAVSHERRAGRGPGRS